MPGVSGTDGWATPIAKTTVGDRYSPSVVSRTNSSVPSGPGSRRVPVQRQPWRMVIPVRAAKVSRLACISGRDGKFELPSMKSGMIARFSVSSARRLFQSYRS